MDLGEIVVGGLVERCWEMRWMEEMGMNGWMYFIGGMLDVGVGDEVRRGEERREREEGNWDAVFCLGGFCVFFSGAF